VPSKLDLPSAERAAVNAARAVGKLLRANLREAKRANSITQHDIKLELDVRSQQLIEKTLLATFPKTAVLGEEGISGDISADHRWVVDPIDGTVNFAYGIPHACISIALQGRANKKSKSVYPDGFETVVGVVYDPFCDEMWTARRDSGSRLNGKAISVSKRAKLDDTIVSIGFAKTRESVRTTLPYFNKLVRKVRKVRMMGAAALALTYVATGRFDGYIERGIHLWDIAAGGLIIEQAGGEFWREPVAGDHAFRMIASNGLIRKKLNLW
jgi:myo-inositol-1(or 4)-monophosphatase